MDTPQIRLLKRGVHFERVFEVFAETSAAPSPTLEENDYIEVLDCFVDPPDVLFRETMAIHLGWPALEPDLGETEKAKRAARRSTKTAP